MSSSHRRIRVTLAVVLLALLCISLVSWGCGLPPSLEGVYYDGFIGSSEPFYWVFRDGRVWLSDKGASNIAAGVFVRSNGVWILRGDTLDVILKPTPFGLRMISKPDSGMCKYLPRRGFSWLKSGESRNLTAPLGRTNPASTRGGR
jgi:hypothetical protein